MWSGLPEEGHDVGRWGNGIEFWSEGLWSKRLGCKIVIVVVSSQRRIVEVRHMGVLQCWRRLGLGDRASLTLTRARAVWVEDIRDIDKRLRGVVVCAERHGSKIRAYRVVWW